MGSIGRLQVAQKAGAALSGSQTQAFGFIYGNRNHWQQKTNCPIFQE